MGRKPVYDQSARDFIVSKAATLKDKELAEQLSALIGKPVSVQSVRKQRQKLGVMKASGRGKCSVKDNSPVPTVDVNQPAASLPNNPSETVSSPFVLKDGDDGVSIGVTDAHNGDEGGLT